MCIRYMKYLGIDIGGTAVKYGIVTEDGTVLQRAEYPVAFDGYKTPIGDTVLKTSKDFLEVCHMGMDELSGIGVSATGQIHTKAGTVEGSGGNIINWVGTNLKQKLEAQFQVKTTVVNDANCVAIGEQWMGAAKGKDNVIVVTIGTGVGGGIIQNGEVLLGNQGFAGELGHFSIDRNGPTCTCGNRGCYEQYASMTALVRMVREQLPLKDYPLDTKEKIDGREIFAAVESGNDEMIALVEQWITDIAAGLVSLTHIFNPELILLGGGVSKQEELFIAKLREKVLEKVMVNFGRQLEVKAAKLGNHAGLVGAVSYLIQQESEKS